MNPNEVEDLEEEAAVQLFTLASLPLDVFWDIALFLPGTHLPKLALICRSLFNYFGVVGNGSFWHWRYEHDLNRLVEFGNENGPWTPQLIRDKLDSVYRDSGAWWNSLVDSPPSSGQIALNFVGSTGHRTFSRNPSLYPRSFSPSECDDWRRLYRDNIVCGSRVWVSNTTPCSTEASNLAGSIRKSEFDVCVPSLQARGVHVVLSSASPGKIVPKGQRTRLRLRVTNLRSDVVLRVQNPIGLFKGRCLWHVGPPGWSVAGCRHTEILHRCMDSETDQFCDPSGIGVWIFPSETWVLEVLIQKSEFHVQKSRKGWDSLAEFGYVYKVWKSGWTFPKARRGRGRRRRGRGRGRRRAMRHSSLKKKDWGRLVTTELRRGDIPHYLEACVMVTECSLAAVGMPPATPRVGKILRPQAQESESDVDDTQNSAEWGPALQYAVLSNLVRMN